MKKYPTSYVSREMQSKTMRCHHTPIRMTKPVTLTPSAKKEEIQQEFSCITAGNYGSATLMCVFFFFFNKTKCVLPMQSSSCIPWYSPKGVTNICPHKSLSIDVYCNFIHNCQTLGATKMFFSKWADKPWCIPDSGILFSTKRKWAMKHWRDME